MNTTTTTTPLPALPTPRLRAARQDVDELRSLIESNEWRLEVDWFWSGRNRHGMLRIYEAEVPVHMVEFERNTQVWTDGDANLSKVRTGSPKHLAVLSALAWVRGTLELHS
ncbi:MAG TPA: hypothetical protein VIP27_10255 [Variovorax sp.]